MARTYLTRRLWVSLIVFFALCAIFSFWNRIHGMTLAHPSLVSGWGLVVLMVFLTLYNLRKKLPFLPLTASSTWLQLHLYAGCLTVIFFVMHVDPTQRPSGILEIALLLLYVGVAGSGLLGGYVSRRIPPRLSTRGEEVIYERIPAFYHRQRQEVKALVLRAAEDGGSTAIPDFYMEHLHAFFSGPRNLWHHLHESRRPLHQLLHAMGDLSRFLSAEEQATLDQVKVLVREKDDLDYKYVHMAFLKYWLFVHIPLTYSLMMVALLHVVLVHAFGGVR
jgi:hypothetical protein